MDQTKNLGTDAMDTLIAAFAEGIKDFRAANADGKVELSDIALFMPLIAKVGPVLQTIGQVPSELLNLDSSEGAHVLSEIVALVGDNQDKVRLIVEGVVQMALGGLKAYQGLSMAA